MYFMSWYFLFLIFPLMYIFLRKKKEKSIKFSNIQIIKDKIKKSTYKHLLGKILIFIGLVFLLAALSRPQDRRVNEVIYKEGIDIVLVLDISGSMKSVDIVPNRLEAAKKVMLDFARKRVNDRIGLVIFAGGAYTKLPLTLDYQVIERTISMLNFDDINNNNQTAIGLGISVGLNRLKNSESDSKIMILATDGSNNAGEISPEMASKLAQEMNVKIYTIGVGSEDTVFNINGRLHRGASDLDEKLLIKIADDTNGKYFRAKDLKSLNEIFNTIDKLEKTKVEENTYSVFKELFKYFVRLGIIFLTLGLFLDRYLIIRIP